MQIGDWHWNVLGPNMFPPDDLWFGSATERNLE